MRRLVGEIDTNFVYISQEYKSMDSSFVILVFRRLPDHHLEKQVVSCMPSGGSMILVSSQLWGKGGRREGGMGEGL